jgi:hypothetical protein
MHDYILHDLKENKTLELGKDFLYGGGFIMIKVRNICNYGQVGYDKKFNKTPPSESTHTKLIPILEKTGAELFGDRFVLIPYFEYKEKIIRAGDIIQIDFEYQGIETNFYHSKSSKKYSILFNSMDGFQYKTNRSINCDLIEIRFLLKEFFPEEIIKSNSHIKEMKISDHKITIDNIFQEYSKLLAGENNQFEEFCEKIR